MTFEDSALWVFFLAGLLSGWWWRGRAERKAHRDDLPQWLAVLGRSLASQMHRIDTGHRFAGDEVTICNTQTYGDDQRTYEVTVTRKQSVTIDQ